MSPTAKTPGRLVWNFSVSTLSAFFSSASPHSAIGPSFGCSPKNTSSCSASSGSTVPSGARMLTPRSAPSSTSSECGSASKQRMRPAATCCCMRATEAGAAELEGKRLVIFGGGDSALDWTLELLGKAASLTLVHRRHEFRAAPASVARMQQHVAAGRMRCFEALPHSLLVEDGVLRGVNIRAPDGTVEPLEAEQLLVFFGLHPKLGPIAEWGLALEKKALKVDTEKFQ